MPAYKLSVLIPSIESRKPQFTRLLASLDRQIKKNKLEDTVQIFTIVDEGKDAETYFSIGAKCNELMKHAKGEYVCFIGDDDKIAPTFLADIVKVTRDPYGKDKKKYDCITFKAKMTINGERPMKQVYHIDNKHYQNKADVELRPPGMITPILHSIAKKYPFVELEREKDRGTDYQFATALVNAQVLKNGCHLDKILYYYRYKTKK